ncbi:hypothetical protein FSP39_018992 [Pinctada imbricata]|uniref:Uncharacterized protein n=1 Tax=Pinctada imbricata TaxID=66713 RepID=A0AA89CCV0_PINIB|nr:hypothetical protein FSP39_018992 [Pinctada imbricata]
MDLDAALRLFDVLDSDVETDENMVSVEHVITVPFTEIHKRIDENQNIQIGDLGVNDDIIQYSNIDSVVSQPLEVIVNITTESNQENLDDTNQVFEDELTTEDDSTNYNTEEDTTINSAENFRKSRKRKKNFENWKQTVRKRRRQSGKDYTSVKGKQMRNREIKTLKDCSGKCKYRCNTKISQKEREGFFKEFWNLCDTQKNTFYAKTTDRKDKDRKRTTSTSSRRAYSYSYFFTKGDEKIRVCKTFYLSTLDISQRRIQYHQEHKQTDFADQRGKFTKVEIDPSVRESVKRHIRSFPRMPSHYARKNTSKEFLESELTMKKMYDLYVQSCEEKGEEPCKLHLYRMIFNYDFNIDFYKP